MHRRSLRSSALPTLVFALGFALAACSSGGGGDDGGSGGVGDCPGTGGTATVTDGEVLLCADDLSFDASTIEAPAAVEFNITFTNAESQPHNVAVYTEAGGGGEEISIGEVITGPDATTQVSVEGLEPGTYYFRCDVHPEMEGTIVVEG